MMEAEVCRMCGGDGRVGNALGRSEATCPSCHGSGRRMDTSRAFHDVTKTKQSHYKPAVQEQPHGPKTPVTPEGIQLAKEVSESVVLNAEAKARLLVEIMAHESSHGRCTQTFIKKIRKQARPGQPNL